MPVRSDSEWVNGTEFMLGRGECRERGWGEDGVGVCLHDSQYAAAKLMRDSREQVS